MTAPTFDVDDLASAEDPHRLLAELRTHAPVARLASGFWAVTGYDATTDCLRHRALTTGAIGQLYRAALPPGAARDEMSHRINFLDPPDHTRVRGLVSKAFTPRPIADLTPWITEAAEHIVQQVDTSSPFDLLAEVAHVLPSLVISEMLGIPVADREMLTAWSDAVAPLLGTSPSAEEIGVAIAAAEEFHAYLGALLDERRRRPGADLFSALIRSEEDGNRLSRPELLSLAATLYSAGHRTTRDAFTNGLAALLADDRKHYAALGNGEVAPSAVAVEVLRHQTPTMYVARVPAEDVEIGGQPIGAGEPVIVYLAAANRDPARYSEPDEFRPGRDGPPPLSFALGAHHCLGAALAKTEIETLLTVIVRAWPTLQLAGHRVHWHLRGPFRGVDELLVAVD